MGITSIIQHCTVMEREVLTLLNRPTPAIYLDCTLGAGGHARALLQANAEAIVLGFDRDPACIAAAQQWSAPWKNRFLALQGNFRDLTNLLHTLGYSRVDGILLDLGVSSYQLDTPERGFSFRADGPLDMRMDTTQQRTAGDILQQASVEELQRIFRDLGEERWARHIARAIVTRRQHTTFTRTHQLAMLVAEAIPRTAWPPHIHPATRVFMALRMAVNEELAALSEVLPQAVAALRPEGRLAVIAFHSIEDRYVKHFLRQEARGCVCPPKLPQCCCGRQPQLKVLTPRPLLPTDTEVEANPRSRSARLRGAAKLAVKE